MRNIHGVHDQAERLGRCLRVYVGTRAAPSNHIHCLSLDLVGGRLAEEAPPCPTHNSSFIAVHPDLRTLYALDEKGDASTGYEGNVSAYAIDRQCGVPTFTNRQPSGGRAPCFLSVAPDRRYCFVANYGSGSFSVFPITVGGALGPVATFVQHEGGMADPRREPVPHVHWVAADPTSSRLVVTDLGCDEVLTYPFDTESRSPVGANPARYHLPDGTGPRHAAFLAAGRRLAVVGEFASTVTLFDYDARSGRLANARTRSTLPQGWRADNAAAEIAVSQDEKFLYVSNRGHDSIAIFRIDADATNLEFLVASPSGGRWPRHFAIDPSGCLVVVANQRSNSLATHFVDRASGRLWPTGHTYPVSVPTCVVILPETPASRFLS